VHRDSNASTNRHPYGSSLINTDKLSDPPALLHSNESANQNPNTDPNKHSNGNTNANS
jgi:hypothetical protein